ncbi:MAG: cytochrome c [Planctomycetota bacterium]
MGSPNVRMRSRRSRRRRLVAAGSASGLLVLLVTSVILAACSPPDYAEVADVEVILNAPRSDDAHDALIDNGRKLFIRHSCHNCHAVKPPARGAPVLRNLYTTQAVLLDGTAKGRDRAYLIGSILHPREHVVAGYPQAMSNYRHLPAEEVAALVAYLESMSPPPGPDGRGLPTASR